MTCMIRNAMISSTHKKLGVIILFLNYKTIHGDHKHCSQTRELAGNWVVGDFLDLSKPDLRTPIGNEENTADFVPILINLITR